MEKIVCDKCGKFRPKTFFRKFAIETKQQFESYKLICDYCGPYGNYYKSLEKTVETKHCLKCGKMFRSINGYRLCYPCKYENQEQSGDYTLVF